jgi:aspergillopepsin I
LTLLSEVLKLMASQYDSEYLCPVTVGSQTLNLDFDTGSSDL